MFRRFVLMPLVLTYMMALVLAAWPEPIRPLWLNGEHRRAETFFDSIGIKAGMSVFAGSREPLEKLLVGRCTIATAINADGRRRRIYPTDPCPPEGVRLSPVVYEHMIVHWTARIPYGDKDSNLAALGDHFCQLANDPNVVRVLLELEKSYLNYMTLKTSEGLHYLGEVECRS